MSEEELQNEEENKEENNENLNEDIEQNAENNNELNQEEENKEEAKEDQNEQEQVQEPQEQEQEQENAIENGNNEEIKEIENNLNENENNEQIENIEPIEENKENEVIDNNEDQEEINIVANNNNNENENKITQENEHQIDDELINKEMSIKSSKNNSNGNINVENGLSFGRHGLLEGNINFNNNLNLNIKKNTHQLLNEINNDMDLLSEDLRPLFNNHKIKQEFNYKNEIENYDYNEFGQEDKEIKDLIKKANKLVNEHSYNYYGQENNNNLKYKNYNIKNNLSEIYPPNKYEFENGGNYSNYMERNENSSSEEEEDDNDTGYMRNISPEKNINKNRIKNIRNIYEYNNSKNYNKRPIIYRQKETFPIKNSYMNEVIGQPQTFQKMEYSNNLVFSSDKIAFRKIKYGGGNINQSLDVLFNGQK